SACPGGNVSPNPELTIRRAPNRLPKRTRARLRFALPDSRALVAPLLSLSAELPHRCRKRLPVEPRWLAISPQFPFCRPVWQNPQPASSVRAPYPDGRHRPWYQRQVRVRNSHIRAYAQTTALVAPFPWSRSREKRERKEPPGRCNYQVFAAALGG